MRSQYQEKSAAVFATSEAAAAMPITTPETPEATLPDSIRLPSKPDLLRNAPDSRQPDTGTSRFEQQDSMPGVDSGREIPVEPILLIDISDLIYYIGNYRHLSGIQRVQSSIIISILRNNLYSRHKLIFLSFENRTHRWMAIASAFILALLEDLFLPEPARTVRYDTGDACHGLLPGAKEFNGTGILNDGKPSVLCTLGAAWVHQDYLHRVLVLKRRFGTRFVMTIHDLVPIYAREFCEQDAVRVFEEFINRSLRHVDHILSVSENTANDIKRYFRELGRQAPPITVTRNGSSFDEFMSKRDESPSKIEMTLPERFVLFVATIEGRKNHQLMLKIWESMIAQGDDPPHLVCVGRLGWKSSAFLSRLIETKYLQGRVLLLQDVSDLHLRTLYQRCLFTVCPTYYEGWGLPVGEALALGKICVCSDRASIPEVAGGCGVYIDIDNFENSLSLIRDLIQNDKLRSELELNIRSGYQRVEWQTVAETIVQVCVSAAGILWNPPYPRNSVPYAKEITFARLDREINGTGELLLSRLVSQRRGHFLDHTLDESAFILGEEVRSDGFWAYPEHWGTWACFSGGGITLALDPDPSNAFHVFLRLHVSSPLTEEVVRISILRTTVWEGVIGSSGRDIALRIRREILVSSGWRLDLFASVVNFSDDLRDQIASLDSRVPSIGFERCIVIPNGDIATRLDVVSKLLLAREDNL